MSETDANDEMPSSCSFFLTSHCAEVVELTWVTLMVASAELTTPHTELAVQQPIQLCQKTKQERKCRFVTSYLLPRIAGQK